MEAIRITEFVPSVSVLRPQTIPRPPAPGSNEVLVEIHSAALNHVDILYAQGKHQNNTSLVRPPFTLGLEFAGTVLAVGPTTTTHEDGHKSSAPPLRPGDRVFGAHLGAFATHILVPAQSLHRIPASHTFRSAAGLAATASVAYGAVAIRARVKQGDWVLVHGAAGGIGVYACQIAKALGARVIAGVRSQADVQGKLRKIQELGAGCVEFDGVVVTGQEEGWAGEIRRITGGRGVDVVIDNVGLVKESLRCLRPVGGKIVLVGFAGRQGVMEKIGINRVLLRQAVIIGYRYGETNRHNPAETVEVWTGLMKLVESGLIKPIVYEKKYDGLEGVRTAMEDLQARKIYGKAVIDIKQSSSRPAL
ncbi:hypothetical protein VTO42DRAFT_3066 [Malbranchea cinnamomea]